MIIKSIKEPQKFFETIQKCKGNVELATSEGDLLNLKSTLCQYIALTQMFEELKNDEVEFELILSNEDDIKLLSEFIMET
ncbi:MAG: polya polymerase [Eubacteriales bacterium]